MTINQLINYKHSLFAIKPKTTEHLRIVKSRLYGGVEYVVRGNSLVMVISDSTVAKASADLWRTIEGERAPSVNDYAMWDDENA